ncbi:6-pyruvoyl-tetrahydropterin synthase-related protein [Patescibacteria group bacterium]|nr:6-pyruvoyl-tetrahydropterin synthase-related protein [Patescibacteria group bacterium]
MKPTRITSLPYYIAIILVSILPLVSLFATPALFHTHDGAVHLPRMAAYFKALMDGQVLPRWAGDLNYGYGLPLFNFIYHTPYLISSLFIGLGASLVMTFKIVAALSFILAGVFMLLFARELWHNDRTALLVAVFYQFAPFRLVELMVRGSFGEMYVYAFIPLVLYFLLRTLRGANARYIAGLALAAALLVISHNSISLVMFGVAVLFLFLMPATVSSRIRGALGLGAGLAVSAFYWIPALLEHKYTYGDLFMKNLFRSYFPSPLDLLFPNITNAPAFQNGGVSVQIGLFHILAFAAVLFLFLKHAKLPEHSRRIWYLSLTAAAVAVFFMSTWSLWFWNHIAILRQFQFPWRLLSVVNLASALSASAFMELTWFKKPAGYIAILVLVIISTAWFWKPPLGYDRIENESVYWNYPLDTTYFGETDVIWSAGPAKKYPPSQVSVIAGNATVSAVTKRSNLHTYAVDASGPASLVDETEYFPGWHVYVDGAAVPIQFQDQNWRGLITYAVPSGRHTVRVKFDLSGIQRLGTIISVVSVIALGTLFLLVPRKTVS